MSEQDHGTHPGAMDPVGVYEASSPVDADLVCNLLRDAGIPAVERERNSMGGLTRLYTGSSLYGTRVLVDRADEAAARELIAALVESDGTAPVDDLTRQAMAELSEEELGRQAETEPARPVSGNDAYRWMRVAAAILLLLAAAAIIWTMGDGGTSGLIPPP